MVSLHPQLTQISSSMQQFHYKVDWDGFTTSILSLRVGFKNLTYDCLRFATRYHICLRFTTLGCVCLKLATQDCVCVRLLVVWLLYLLFKLFKIYGLIYVYNK